MYNTGASYSHVQPLIEVSIHSLMFSHGRSVERLCCARLIGTVHGAEADGLSAYCTSAPGCSPVRANASLTHAPDLINLVGFMHTHTRTAPYHHTHMPISVTLSVCVFVCVSLCV